MNRTEAAEYFRQHLNNAAYPIRLEIWEGGVLSEVVETFHFSAIEEAMFRVAWQSALRGKLDVTLKLGESEHVSPRQETV